MSDEYISREAFITRQRELYCQNYDRRRGMKDGKLTKRFVYPIGGAPCRACDVDDMINAVEDYPAADVVARDCFDKILAENDDMRAIIDTYGGLENIQSAFVKLHEIQTADVRPVVIAENIGKDYAECDQFVCSKCGIELQDWHRVERDEDNGEETYHEYVFRFCPNCGAKVEVEHD